MPDVFLPCLNKDDDDDDDDERNRRMRLVHIRSVPQGGGVLP